MEDRQAFDLMMSSDQAGLESLIEKYDSYVMKVVSYILGRNSHELQECSNDVWLSVWKQADRFNESISCAKTWICVIAKYKAINYLKKAINHDHRLVALPTSDHRQILREASEIAELLERKEDLQSRSTYLGQALLSLPDKERNLIIRRYYFMEPIKVIAGSLGLSRAAIDNQLSRIRKSLKARYQEMIINETHE